MRGMRCVLWVAGILLGLLTPLLGADEDVKTAGTAFVVGADGYLITCAHLVRDAGKVSVTLGGKTYEAAVLATDVPHDLALLQIAARGLTALPLGNSNQVEAGLSLRAFGAPPEKTVQQSACKVTAVNMRDAQKIFQLDVPVEAGFSGAPLVNARGEVLGMDDARLAGALVSLVGFAVPVNYAKGLLRNEGVAFQEAGAADKLADADLEARVLPAVAQVAAWGRGQQPPTGDVIPNPIDGDDLVKTAQVLQEESLKILTNEGVKPPPDMLLVPSGAFRMGSDDGRDDEKPVRRRALSAFWIDRCEVTNAQFARFMQEANYQPEGPWKTEAGQENYPVTRVSWNDAAAYARWAGKRLPTEAEWEKAARGLDQRRYPWGNDEPTAESANLAGKDDGNEGLAPVGAYQAGASIWGVQDLAGNVWEWCADTYTTYETPPTAGLSKVIRGGSYLSTPAGARSAKRAALLPTLALAQVGFRCVKDEPNLPPVPAVPAAGEPVWEGAVALAGDVGEFKCTPTFDTVHFTTAYGTLTVNRSYLLSVSATELRLAGGSILKGRLTEQSLPVIWTLGRRDIPMAAAAYRRLLRPPVIGVNVTPDGDPVQPGCQVRVTLKDDGLLLGDLWEKNLRLRVEGAGEIDAPIEKITQLATDAGHLRIDLKDGNTVTGNLLGNYHLDILEGSLTINSEQVATLSFVPPAQAGAAPLVNPRDKAELVRIPAGEFKMGSDGVDTPPDEHPQHTVYLDSYRIYKYEVTVAQYRAFCQATGRQMPAQPPWGWIDTHPIVNVTWLDAAAYAEWAGASLPTEAQWEKAARGADGRTWPWGNTFDAARLNYTQHPQYGNKSTAPVGTFPDGASPYGVLDMAGNAWEWCADWYAADYYPNSPKANPPGAANGFSRVLKGGSWDTSNLYTRCAARHQGTPAGFWTAFGFRCVLPD